jgi:putative transposase
MPIRSLKYRLYPNQAQAEWLAGQLRECCDLYNAALEERKSAWKYCRKTVSFYEQALQLRHLRAQGLLLIPNFNCAKEVLRRLDRAYTALFRRGYGFPRFRSVLRYDSLVFPKPTNGFNVHGSMLHLQGCSLISINLHRPIAGKIKTATVKREGSRWFVVLACDVPLATLPAVTGVCGIDVGLTSFVALSDGSAIASPQFFRKAQAKLRRAQRHLARCKSGSKRRLRANQRVARHHVSVRNQRADFHHKLSRKLVSENQFIAVEDLNVKGLARTRLAKSIHDAGWSSFISKLAYKAESAGRTFVKVNPRGTSQTCICGNSVPKKLSDRWHDCAECGASMPRDVMSAHVILQAGRACQIVTKEIQFHE